MKFNVEKALEKLREFKCEAFKLGWTTLEIVLQAGIEDEPKEQPKSELAIHIFNKCQAQRQADKIEMINIIYDMAVAGIHKDQAITAINKHYEQEG